MVLKTELNRPVWQVWLLVDHGSDPIRPFRSDNVQTGIRSVEPMVRPANWINWTISLEQSDSTFFFPHCGRPLPLEKPSPPRHLPPTRPHPSWKATLPPPALEEEMRIQSNGRVRWLIEKIDDEASVGETTSWAAEEGTTIGEVD